MSKSTVPVADPASPLGSIAAKCWQCFGGCDADKPEGIRQTRAEIKQCPSADCALYPFRPYQNKAQEASRK